MKTKKYYLQPNVRVIELEGETLLLTNSDWNGTPGANTDPMPGEE